MLCKIRRILNKSQITFGLIAFLLLGITAFNGPVMEADSISYIEAYTNREAGYVLFLALFRWIFGSTYLYFVVTAQLLLAVYAITSLTNCLVKHFHLRFIIGIGIELLLMIPFFYMTIWYPPHTTYVSRIVTEGVTISLYYLFICFSYDALLRRKLFSMLLPSALAIVLSLTRGQMISLFVITFGICIYIGICQKQIVQALLLFIGSMFVLIVCTNTYAHFTNKGGQKSYANSLSLATNIIYSSDIEDTKLFDNEIYATIFRGVQEQMYQEGYGHTFARGIQQNARLRYNSHDYVKYIVIGAEAEDYYEKLNLVSSEDKQKFLLEFSDTVIHTLLAENFGQFVYDAFCQIVSGMMRSIFTASDSIWYLALVFVTILYLLYVIVMIKCFNKRTSRREAFFAAMILLSLVMNVVGTGTMILAMPRYLLYNFSLFYIALFLMIARKIEVLKKIVYCD